MLMAHLQRIWGTYNKRALRRACTQLLLLLLAPDQMMNVAN
jgi:hypothetical protein